MSYLDSHLWTDITSIHELPVNSTFTCLNVRERFEKFVRLRNVVTEQNKLMHKRIIMNTPLNLKPIVLIATL